MRYKGQSHELPVRFVAEPYQAFHARHEATYGYADPDREVEVVTVRLRARGVTDKPEFRRAGRLTGRMEKIVAELNPDLALKELDQEEFVEHQKVLPDKDMTFKALIADDSTTIRRMLGVSLEKAGFEVTRTINGRIAWDMLQEWKEASIREGRPITDYVHILVSDIEMPAMLPTQTPMTWSAL